jgi:hypothetical protein
MDQKDRVFIESLFAKQGEQLQQQMAQMEQRLTGSFDKKLADTAERFEKRFEASDKKLADTAERLEHAFRTGLAETN